MDWTNIEDQVLQSSYVQDYDPIEVKQSFSSALMVQIVEQFYLNYLMKYFYVLSCRGGRFDSKSIAPNAIFNFFF